MWCTIKVHTTKVKHADFPFRVHVMLFLSSDPLQLVWVDVSIHALSAFCSCGEAKPCNLNTCSAGLTVPCKVISDTVPSLTPS